MNLVERFLNYTQFDTQSAEDSTTVPSTSKQLIFARYLKEELEREGLLVSGGTTGRTVTKREEVLSAMREDALRELARECAEKFRVFGVRPEQAAQLLLSLNTEKEDV